MRDRVALVIAVHCAALLPGCMVMTPSPAVEAAQLLGSAVVNLAAVTPAGAKDAIVHPHEPLQRICIELNPAVALADFVPAVQSELREHGIDSRLYDTGMQPADCPAVLHYTAFLDWDRRALDQQYSMYMSYASLTLRSYSGTVLASASYEVGPVGLDKWSSTRSKLSATVRALLGAD